MNELSAQQNKMSSREIAEIYGKQHNDTLKKIRLLESAYVQAFGAEGNFSHGSYLDGNGQERPEILLNKSQALFVASRFDAVLHAKVQKRWEDLESGKAQPVATAPDVKKMKEADQAFKSALSLAKMIGLTGNQAIISANKLVRKVTGTDAMALLEQKALPLPVEEQAFTPTQLGVFLGVSGQSLNKMLCAAELQVPVKTGRHTTYIPTEHGKKFCTLIDTEKRSGSGAPIIQIKWQKAVIAQLSGSHATDN